MKKGLLSLLVVALTVVGCQDYDDQFDSLNKAISNLKTDISTISGLTTSVAAISTEIKALEGKMVSDSDITGILTQIATVKAAVAALPAPADVSGISTEVADLNTEIATIIEQLTKIQAASGGTYTGNLNITNAVQLTAAEDIVDSSADGPKMTITGNVNIDADETYATNTTDGPANILRVQAILSKLKVVSGNVTITGVDAPMDASELLYVTGNLDVEGTSTMGLGKLNTVDGNVTLDLYGDLSYGLLGSAGSVVLSSTGTITTVNFEGLTTGGVTTDDGELVLPLATSVKVGSLPAVVTLNKAETVQAHGIAALGNMSMTAPLATSVIIKAGSATGAVTITANAAAVDVHFKTIGDQTQIHCSSVALSKLEGITSSLLVSQTAALFAPSALKTTAASITLIGGTTASFNALTSTVSFVGGDVTTFSAPSLAVGSLSNTLHLKAGATVSVKSIGHIQSLTNSSTTAGLTLSAQGTDLILDDMVSLVTLDYTSSVIGGTLTAGTSLVSLTTLTLGSGSKLTTLTVNGTNMTGLSTAGVILNTVVRDNTKLATLSFGHTHLDGQLATTVDIINNDVLLALDMSSLGKVKEVEVTGNASLTTFTAPSVSNKAEPAVTIVVTMTDNDITGTYSATVEATETTPISPSTASSAAITSWKGFIDGYNATNTVVYNLDIDRVDSDADGSFDDGPYSETATTTTNAALSGTISTTIQLAKF